jgi:sugar lactone lactonase YvrE
MRNPHADGPPPQYGWVVTTIAETAGFAGPQEITMDSEGNLFVTDSDHHRICKIDTSGNVDTFAGEGTPDHADGPATNAKFKSPSGITLYAGYLYVADADNHRIRKIDMSGTVDTIAGNGTEDWFDGFGAAAWFRFPRGITADGAGNLYVADSSNHNIRKIDIISGEVSTIAGSTPPAQGDADGIGTAAQFRAPSGITIDSAGNLYVAESGTVGGGHRIRKIVEYPSGTFTVSTIAGGGILGDYADGIGTDARFNTPFGITVDGAGNLYVADRGNHRIRKIANDGSWTVTTIAGDETFNSPHGITLDGAGNLYVVEKGGNRIRKLSWQ